MIAVDTNVLVRYLAQDDPDQARIAEAIIDGAAERDDTLFVSDVVLAETAWVLTRTYRVSRSTLAEIVHRLADARHVAFRNDDRVRVVAIAFAQGSGDFADYLVRELAHEAGCSRVATFDRTLWKEEGFERATAPVAKLRTKRKNR
jgi:predicted nucleic-acid-binding protein